jgi:hypothetical protein
MVSTEIIWLRTVPVTGCCGHGNEFSVSVKGGNSLSSLQIVTSCSIILIHAVSSYNMDRSSEKRGVFIYIMCA